MFINLRKIEFTPHRLWFDPEIATGLVLWWLLEGPAFLAKEILKEK